MKVYCKTCGDENEIAIEMLECMIIEVKIYAMSEGIEAAKQTKMCQLIEKATGLKIEEVLKNV